MTVWQDKQNLTYVDAIKKNKELNNMPDVIKHFIIYYNDSLIFEDEHS